MGIYSAQESAFRRIFPRDDLHENISELEAVGQHRELYTSPHIRNFLGLSFRQVLKASRLYCLYVLNQNFMQGLNEQ